MSWPERKRERERDMEFSAEKDRCYESSHEQVDLVAFFLSFSLSFSFFNDED